MNRRQMLTRLAGATAPLLLPQAAHAATRRSGLGLVIYCCRLRRDWLRRRDPQHDLFEPFTFLEHCRNVGAGGMQADLGTMPPAEAARLRERAAEQEMFIEAIIGPPRDERDVDRFEAEMRTAAQAGARAVRTVIIPGRRYERFDSLEEFREYASRGRRMLELAAPVAERHRLPLAVENHKDQRNDERVALFEHIGSAYVGACVDTGNSVALLEDAVETVRAFAPWAHAVHLKDQAVQPTEEGFLLGDIPLGDGALRLGEMVNILRTAKPDITFTLELITRDPLSVPCLQESYWATFPDLPAVDLARTLRMVHQRRADNLQMVSSLTLEGQAALEDANVRASLEYARDELGI